MNIQTLRRATDWTSVSPQKSRQLMDREWLLTNGLGGYASGTISGHVTRRYHGLLIAGLPSPYGRVVMLNHLAEFLCGPDGQRVQISGAEPVDADGTPTSSGYLSEFRLEHHLPIWRYNVDGIVIEKRIVLVHGQNTVYVTYQLLSDQSPTRLEIRPSCHFRPHEHAVNEKLDRPYKMVVDGDIYEISPGDDRPPLRIRLHGGDATLTFDRGTRREIFYEREDERGYEARGYVWSPGWFSIDLHPNQSTSLVASTEPWPTVQALTPDEAWESELQRRQRLIESAPEPARFGVPAELVLAADQFIIAPTGRVEDAARARAAGDEVRTVIAGYHWFTDWGRDTMISLEGLTLSTGRHIEAGWILRTFAHYVRDGLIPNLFPEGKNDGLYHTADATLWFFHAVDRYVETTGDRATLRLILPKLVQIVEAHRSGTRFGIGVDPTDHLLRQGAEGYQLTWMDAKVGDWVVTPRRGKAVEINALWYNALRLLDKWYTEEKETYPGRDLAEEAELIKKSFNQRFWFERGQYLYDVVDGEQGDDTSFRPNQIFAISLRYPVLDEQRWEKIVRAVQERLVTPVGLRSLAPGEKDYKSRYFGDLRARDAAYHQGTVWAWLIGPFIDAWLRVYPDDTSGARHFLDGFGAHLDDACVGTISEVFDADAPFTPRACIAQAWSVAEVLRTWLKTEKPSTKPTRQTAARALK